MRTAVHRVVVELRMLASPLEIRSSPQPMATHGMTALVNAMIANPTTRPLHPGPNSGLRSANTMSARAAKPDAERKRSRAVGLMSWTVTLIRRNETPHISARATNAAYGSNGFLASDTRRPVVGGEHEGDRPVVLDAHAHNRPEAPRARLYSTRAKPLHENLVELLRARGVCGLQQARPLAVVHAGEQAA